MAVASSCSLDEAITHRDNGGSGAGVLGHPPARKARRRVLKTPGPGTPRCPCVCNINRLAPELFIILKKCCANLLWAMEEEDYSNKAK